MLEKRFRETVGRSILEDIQLVRLERAKRLLVETQYPISKIARLTGFGTTGYFIQFFHEASRENSAADTASSWRANVQRLQVLQLAFGERGVCR